MTRIVVLCLTTNNSNNMQTLKKGSKGEEVRLLQNILHLYVDGIFGPLTEEAVMDFQKENKLTPDGIVGPKTWEALLKGKTAFNAAIQTKTTKRTINEIIVHCTASKEGVNQTVESIRNYHVNVLHWSDIAYHFVVYLDGSIHAGRPVDRVGGHTKGHNTHSIGVVYVGGLDKNGKAKDTRTPQQKEALLKLIRQLKKDYPKATVHGHREFANKACPCFDAKSEYKDV